MVDGAAQLQVVEVPKADFRENTNTKATATMSLGTRKIVANMPPGKEPSDIPPEELKPIKGLKIKGSHTITGPHVQPVKGAGGRLAKIVLKEGLWEDRRGHKIDGGERRQAEVRAKRRGEERKNTKQ